MGKSIVADVPYLNFTVAFRFSLFTANTYMAMQHRMSFLDGECELLPIITGEVQALINPRLPEVAIDGVALKVGAKFNVTLFFPLGKSRKACVWCGLFHSEQHRILLLLWFLPAAKPRRSMGHVWPPACHLAHGGLWKPKRHGIIGNRGH